MEAHAVDANSSHSSPTPDLLLSSPSWPAIAFHHSSLPLHARVDGYLRALHVFLSSFTYKTDAGPEHTPDVQRIKAQSMRVICQQAELIVQRRLPIKCLEAVVVALHLTAAITAPPLSRPNWRLTRFPLRFHTACEEHRYWHILLVLELTWSDAGSGHVAVVGGARPSACRRFGAVSVSRHPPLSFRPLEHASLSSLCSSLRDDYLRIGHRVVHVTVGLPVEEAARSKDSLDWHFLSVPLAAAKEDDRSRQPQPLSRDEAEEASIDGEEGEASDELPMARPLSPLAEGAEAAEEWRRACRVLDRYALHAHALLHALRVNRRRPSMARPLPPLHPLVHWEPRTQQLLYTPPPEIGKDVRGGTLSGKGQRVGAKKKEWTEEKVQSSLSARLTSATQRRATPATSRLPRSAFAV